MRAGVGSRVRMFTAVAALAVAVAAAWTALQPQRSLDRTDDALAALNADPPQIGTARNLAREAEKANPLAVDPLFVQAAIEIRAKNLDGAEQALEDAVKLQPANPSTWTTLADFQLNERKDTAKAKETISRALYLDPGSVQAVQLLILINRTATASS
jgi:cytochrome c-type biogenesis protein CcmH/NrfG